MRVEAVQNERRPYPLSQPSHPMASHQRYDSLHPLPPPHPHLAAHHLSKGSPSGALNPMMIGTSNGLYPLTSFLANLTNHRDETMRMTNKEHRIQQQSTLHSILTSTSRVRSPPPPSSTGSSTTTSLRIDCNIKTETMAALSTKIHQQQAAAVAISQAFDNLAKAAAQVRRA